MRLEAHHLRMVRAIAETGSLSRAASALGVSQPAVSGRLKRLEQMLGCQLFDRGDNTVIPTPMGELLLRRTAAVLPLMENLAEEIQPWARASQPPTIRVGAVCSAVVPHLEAVVAKICPGSTASVLNDECCAGLLALLSQRRLEVALIKEYPGFEQSAPDEVATATIVVEPTFVQLPSNHRLASRTTVDLAELRDENWALPPMSSARFHEYFNDTCARLGFSPTVSHTASEVVTLMAVRSGAVGLVQPACEDSHGVVIRALAGNVLPRRHVLAWHRGGFLAARSRELLAAVTEAYWTEAMASSVYRRHFESLA